MEVKNANRIDHSQQIERLPAIYPRGAPFYLDASVRGGSGTNAISSLLSLHRQLHLARRGNPVWRLDDDQTVKFPIPHVTVALLQYALTLGFSRAKFRATRLEQA